jgi:imidazolonepropionase-like amidohydrolase
LARIHRSSFSCFATHKELQSFVEAGLTPYEAIEAATRNPAEYFAEVMKVPRDFGTVEVGMRADLLLLDANPLQSRRKSVEARRRDSAW